LQAPQGEPEPVILIYDLLGGFEAFAGFLGFVPEHYDHHVYKHQGKRGVDYIIKNI
jgi:hypothetical protein